MGTKLLLGGWIVADDKVTDKELSFNSSEAGETLLFPRQDVCEIFKCSDECSAGFLVCIDKTNADDIRIKWREQEVVVPYSKLNFAAQLHSVDPLPNEFLHPATTLLEKHGFYWGQKAHKWSGDSQDSISINHKKSKIQIDYSFILDTNSLLIIGWVLDTDSEFKRLNIRINNTISNNILEDAYFHPRFDVCEVLGIPTSQGEKIGFVFTISLPEPIDSKLELMYSVDGRFFTGVPLTAGPFKREETWLTEILLANVDVTDTTALEKLNKHVTSGLELSWKNRLTTENEAKVFQFGQKVEAPTMSVIIPIYGRYDFIQLQMSQFSLDDDFKGIEVIYVLDDPRIEHPFLVTCHGVYETFNVPFKAVVSTKNLGYAGANNLGVNYASSDNLLLMNSDVIPKEPGHFSKMLLQFRESSDAGVLGGTLLYEDLTVQHMGMEYMQDPSHPGMWMNYHPQKGFPLSLADEFEIRKAQAVTGALMMLSKEDYISVGGFDIGYILGDFEDSDLCMKIRGLGKEIMVSGLVKMYHLERLSQSLVSEDTWKHKLSMLNGLRHTKKWNKKVENLVGKNE